MKKTLYLPPTLPARSVRPLERLIPRAATARRGMPTPVIRKPITAGHTLNPATCPMYTGKIRLPAPKNMPKSMLVIDTVSATVSFVLLRLLFIISPSNEKAIGYYQ